MTLFLKITIDMLYNAYEFFNLPHLPYHLHNLFTVENRREVFFSSFTPALIWRPAL